MPYTLAEAQRLAGWSVVLAVAAAAYELVYGGGSSGL
jgi:hypothetical protein